jgi:hypothetical protein
MKIDMLKGKIGMGIPLIAVEMFSAIMIVYVGEDMDIRVAILMR